MTATNERHILRSKILHFLHDPFTHGDDAWEYFEDGLLIVNQGRVETVGPAAELMPMIHDSAHIEHLPDHLITPGFVDTHIHFPQTEMIAAFGEQLLSWLNTYTFPSEAKFADYDYGKQTATVFLDELLRNGTTTALVFGTVHPTSVDAFFGEAQQRGLRMIAGKVLMDRNAPAALCDTPQTGYHQSKSLIEKWHNIERLQYAVTPRFAPTSTTEQLQTAGQLLQEHPDVYMHTHLAENPQEMAWVAELFPESATYLDVYDKANLLGKRSIFAHGIHLQDCDCERLAKTNSALSHCPTSNLFLGSGLFNLKQMQSLGVKVGLGTDVGGGTSFSMFRTMDEAYKIQQLRGHTLDPFQAHYLATLGGAKALDLNDKIGNFETGKEADFIVLNLKATPFLSYRTPYCQSIKELLFVLNTLADDRVVDRVYAMGQIRHNRNHTP